MKRQKKKPKIEAHKVYLKVRHSVKSLCVSVSYLDELSVAGECAVEYLGLYQKLIKPTHWKVYLAARGVLPYIGNLITKVTLLPCCFTGFIKCSEIH